ncbi:hypothetical protein D3C85_1406240 [compost metagenome]
MARGRDLAVDLVDGLGIPLDRGGRADDVAIERIGDGLSHVQRFKQRKLFAIREQEGRKLEHDAFALKRRHARPVATFKRVAATCDRAIDVRLSAGSDICNLPPGGRIHAVESARVDRVDVCAVDVGASFDAEVLGAVMPIDGCRHRLPLGL